MVGLPTPLRWGVDPPAALGWPQAARLSVGTQLAGVPVPASEAQALGGESLSRGGVGRCPGLPMGQDGQEAVACRVSKVPGRLGRQPGAPEAAVGCMGGALCQVPTALGLGWGRPGRGQSRCFWLTSRCCHGNKPGPTCSPQRPASSFSEPVRQTHPVLVYVLGTEPGAAQGRLSGCGTGPQGPHLSALGPSPCSVEPGWVLVRWGFGAQHQSLVGGEVDHCGSGVGLRSQGSGQGLGVAGLPGWQLQAGNS